MIKDLLKDNIVNYIKKNNYITLGKLMQLALSSKYGYYSNINPFGLQPDFYTAPEISSVFGNLIGAWFYNLWLQMDSPIQFILLELGAGSGLLLKDILHVNKHNTAFLKAINLYILDINPLLKQQQINNLQEYFSSINSYKFINNINKLQNTNNLPILVIANEFLDALPIQQFVFNNNVWNQIAINYTNNNFNIINIQPQKIYNKLIMQLGKNFVNNSVYEEQVVANKYFSKISLLIQKYKGLALFIDYGMLNYMYKSSIRGFYKHNILTLENILQILGKTDITYNVNFLKLQNIADNLLVNRINTISQADFLTFLGIKEYLKTINNINVINNANRLINNNMGNKFKVIAVFNGLTL